MRLGELAPVDVGGRTNALRIANQGVVRVQRDEGFPALGICQGGQEGIEAAIVHETAILNAHGLPDRTIAEIIAG